MDNTDTTVKTYYDACALEYNESIIREITNNPGTNHRAVVSYFALGEAYGNSLNKDKLDKGGRADSFLWLIQALNQYIDIVGNDGNEIESLVTHIKQKLPKISIADALHLATAINNFCCTFRTRDSGLYELTTEEQLCMIEEHELKSFKISAIVEPIPKSSYQKKKAAQYRNK